MRQILSQSLKSSVVLLALATAGAVAANAQAPETSQQPPHHQFDRRGPNPEFETKMLTKRLSLTPEQAAQVEPILAASHESMKALKPAENAQAADFKAMREQHKAIMDETNQKLNAVFTPEQQEKFAKMHEHMGPGPRGPRGQFGPRPGAVPASTAAPTIQPSL